MHHAFNVLHCYHKQDTEAPTGCSVTYYFGAFYTNLSFRGFLGYARNNSECYFFTHDVKSATATSAETEGKVTQISANLIHYTVKKHKKTNNNLIITLSNA